MTTATIDKPTVAAGAEGTYYQCYMRQGNVYVTAWIEKRGAKAGARVELKGKAGLWDVLTVHEPPMTIGALREKQKRDRGGLKSIR